LKSIEKVMDGEARNALREARGAFKQAAYDLLGRMIEEISGLTITQNPLLLAALDAQLAADAAELMAELHARMTDAVSAVRAVLPKAHTALLDREYDRWLEKQEWSLINAGDSCGT
jgi:hypothetical protein